MTLLKIFNAKKEKKKNSPIKLKKVRRYTPNDSEILQKIDKKLFYAEINGADSIKINDPTSSDIRSYSLKLASIILEWIHKSERSERKRPDKNFPQNNYCSCRKHHILKSIN